MLFFTVLAKPLKNSVCFFVKLQTAGSNLIKNELLIFLIQLIVAASAVNKKPVESKILQQEAFVPISLCHFRQNFVHYMFILTIWK